MAAFQTFVILQVPEQEEAKAVWLKQVALNPSSSLCYSCCWLKKAYLSLLGLKALERSLLESFLTAKWLGTRLYLPASPSADRKKLDCHSCGLKLRRGHCGKAFGRSCCRVFSALQCIKTRFRMQWIVVNYIPYVFQVSRTDLRLSYYRFSYRKRYLSSASDITH